MSDIATIDSLQRVVPPNIKPMITSHLVDTLNGLIKNDSVRDAFKENLFGFTSVLKDPRFSIEQYINAVRFVTYKSFQDTNLVAYTKVFPDRYQNMVDKEWADKDINSCVSQYNKSKMVTAIAEMMLIPSHIVNAPIYQKAINHLAYLMTNARSEKVQSDSAAKLVDALKIPETIKMELDIGAKEGSIIDDLRKSTAQLVAQQKLMLQAGAIDAKGVADSKLVFDAEFEEVSE